MLDALDVESLKVFLRKKVEIVVDQSNRTIRNNTLLQLAYGAKHEEMCFALKGYFVKAFGSEEAAWEELGRQLDEKFPKNDEERKLEEVRDLEIKNKLKVLLDAVILAISNEHFDLGKDEKGRWILGRATLQAINTFRAEFDALHPTIIDWGWHYRTASTQETGDAYAQAERQWNYDDKKCGLFEDGVLSHVLKHTPGNIASNFCQGLYYLQKRNPEAPSSSLMTRDGHPFYSYLGGESGDFVGILGRCFYICAPGEGVERGGGGAALLQIYFQTKTERLANLRGEHIFAQNKLER